MKLTINYNKEQLTHGLRVYKATIERKARAESNPGIVALLDKDISELEAAINSIQETK